MSLLKKRSGSSRAKRKLADISKDAVESDSAVSDSDSSSDPDSGSEAEDPPVREVETVADEPDEPVLSHAERRKRKKRKLNSGDATPGEIPAPSRPKRVRERGGRKSGEVSEGGDALPKRQNSVWVGNLAYKTTPVTLKAFFEGLEVTRINMPSKPPPNGVGPKINSGFAYVDFATPDAKLVAITWSERNLEGRRLLIKDGDDFAGRPTATATPDADGTTATEATTSKPGVSKTGLTKTAQRILNAQKQPPGPTLFFGNLGFEVTEDSIRQLLEAHRKKPTNTPADNDGDSDAADGEGGDDTKAKQKGSQKEDKWIRKIRMGTFEDSGKCKGWAFVDFTSTEHATAALINPRNHSLDGRKLSVEYASPDAVRRGGGPREPDSSKKLTRTGERGKKVRKPKSAGYIRKGPKSAERRSVNDGEGELEKKREATGGGERAPGRGISGRRKPGAALASAQRGTAAILPSQGQKITF